MKVGAAIVGQASAAEQVAVDKRWIMAYNAALGELSDTPHPLFPVSYEWPATHALRVATGLQEANARLVHAQRPPARAAAARRPRAKSVRAGPFL